VRAALADQLAQRGVRAATVNPGTAIASYSPRRPWNQPRRLLFVAADLEEPRKRIGWALTALKTGLRGSFLVTLAGSASPSFQRWTRGGNFPAEFVGRLSRDRLPDLMRQNDLFVFSSAIDDWGYVQVEAMGQGLMVIAPRLAPFDEIIGNAGVLYSPHSTAELVRAVQRCIDNEIPDAAARAWERASTLFSRRTFGVGLAHAIDSHTGMKSSSASTSASRCE
jgi:glycosyltransferase involved in cell wall biosynthesis